MVFPCTRYPFLFRLLSSPSAVVGDPENWQCPGSKSALISRPTDHRDDGGLWGITREQTSRHSSAGRNPDIRGRLYNKKNLIAFAMLLHPAVGERKRVSAFRPKSKNCNFFIVHQGCKRLGIDCRAALLVNCKKNGKTGCPITI